MLAKVAAVSQFPGFVNWSYADQTKSDPSPGGRRYQPQFFTATEYQTIDQLSELIIPEDGTPGARAAGVAEFIDFMTAADSEIQRSFRNGLVWLDKTAKAAHGNAFLQLPEQRQTELLRQAASAKPGTEGHAFFDLVRRYTVMGYYTSRIGLKELDFPGLQMYAQSPACPHHDDPEHKHLSGSRV